MHQPTWISHRGYCLEATENTAESFDAALTLGFTHLETDLRSTADGHLVLAHDDDLSRVAGESVKVTETSRAELEALTLRGGERLLFFDQWWRAFGRWRWILDIKPEAGERTLELLDQWSQKPELADFLNERARFLFWDRQQQSLWQSRHPGAECMATVGECRVAGVACQVGLPALGGLQPGRSYALPPKLGRVPLLSPTVVERYHRQRARVLAYLPESEPEVDRALDSGADEILTNHQPRG